jgi:RNA polymerase sigma factor (TIGR02999 family)
MTVTTQELLPIVYAQLRQMADREMSAERADHTLQATALINEAYIRLAADNPNKVWDHAGHFYAAAAEAMRRILVDHARRRNSLKRGGDHVRLPFTDSFALQVPAAELLLLDDALAEFEQSFPRQAALVKLRYFAGMSHQDAAAALEISRATADRDWAFAKVWLFQQVTSSTATPIPENTDASGTQNSHS